MKPKIHDLPKEKLHQQKGSLSIRISFSSSLFILSNELKCVVLFWVWKTCVLCVALCNVGYLSTRVCVLALKASVCVLLLVKACVCVEYSEKISHVVREYT